MQKSDFEGLGSLLLRAGVDPIRAENMVRDLLRAQLDEQTACQQDFQKLGEASVEALDAIRSEQRQMLKAINHTLFISRSESGLYQRAFSSATGLTNRLIMAVIISQFVIIGLVCFLYIKM